MREVENVIQILRETKGFVERRMANDLKRLSDRTIHSAMISKDADSVIVAVLVYSLSKIIEREYYRTMDGWDEFYNTVMKKLGEAIKN